MTRTKPLRAIILARVSTKHADQDTSPDRQVARLQAIADAHGWRVVETSIERESGSRVLERPAVASALDQVIHNKADVLLVDHLYRLGRNTRELLEVVDTLHQVGGSFYDASNSLDTTGALGRLIFTVFAAVGEFEISDRKVKIKEGLQRARARGKTLGKKRSVPLEVISRARTLKREVRANGCEPSWAEVVLMLQAEGRGKFSRGAISGGVWVLENQAPADDGGKDGA